MTTELSPCFLPLKFPAGQDSNGVCVCGGGGITYFIYRLFFRDCQIKCVTIHDVKSKKGSNDQELVQSEPNPIILCSKPKWELTKHTNRHSTKRTYGLPSDQLFPKMWPHSDT